MKYSGMPWGMWLMFSGSFRKQLTEILGYDKCEAREIIESAKPEYRRIIAKIPEFEKADRFKMNIVNCAMLSAVPSATVDTRRKSERTTPIINSAVKEKAASRKKQ